MTCSDLETALKAEIDPVYHLSAPVGVTEYVVWHEYGAAAVIGDDRTQILIPRVQIDAYTQDDTPLDSNPLFQTVLGVLDGLDLPYSVQDAGYDNDAAAMRLIIQCDVA